MIPPSCTLEFAALSHQIYHLLDYHVTFEKLPAIDVTRRPSIIHHSLLVDNNCFSSIPPLSLYTMLSQIGNRVSCIESACSLKPPNNDACLRLIDIRAIGAD